MKRRLLRVLLVCALLFTTAVAALLFVATTDTGARWVLARIDAAVGGNLNWAAAEGNLLGGMRIADLAFDNGSSLLRIQRLEFAWQPWRLLDASLVLDSVDIAGLRHQTRVSSAGEALTEAALQRILFDLPLAVELRDFRAERIAVINAAGATVEIDTIAGAASLDGDALTVTRLRVRQRDASLGAELRLTRNLAVSGTAQWQLAYAEQDYAGTLEAGGTLRALELRHELRQPLRLTSSGTLQSGVFGGEAPAFALQHVFPLQSLALFAQPDLQVQGNVRTAGNVEQVDIDGSAHAELPALAPLDLAFALHYRDNALVIESTNLTSAQIGLRASGLLELSPLALRVDWLLDTLDPGARFPQVQVADVSGSGGLELVDRNGVLSTALRVDALNGNLNDYPLAVAGSANLAGADSVALELQAMSGSNTLAVSGNAGTELALAWNLQAPALESLWQGLSGELRGAGNIGGTRAAPEVAGALNGTLQLARDGEVLALQTLALNAEYGAAGNDLRLSFGPLTRRVAGTASVLLQQGELTLSGTPENHALRAALTAPQDSLQLSLQGAALDGNWRGSLRSAELASRAGDWQLQAPVNLEYGAGAWSLAQHCWAWLQTRVCLQADQAAAQGIDAELTLSALPLAWFNPAALAPASKPPALQELQDAFALNLPEGVLTEGSVDVQLSLRNFAAGAWDSLDVVLQPRPWVVQVTQQIDDGADALPLVQRFGLDVVTSELHATRNTWTGALDLSVTHEVEGRRVPQGSLRGSGELAADGSVAASADFAFRDMSWIEFLAPDLRAPTGTLNGTVGVGGTRTQPQLRANMRLSDGSFDVPEYGLNVRDLSLELDTDAANVVRLSGAARSGDGLLQLIAEVTNPLQTQRIVTADISGTDVLAFATDYATVKLSPQLRGSFAGEVLTVNGSVEVANTEIDLEEVLGAGGDDAVTLSRDVVVVSGEQSIVTAQDALRMALDLTVRLGDEVHVSGYDLDAYLNGELRVEQTPGRPVLVYGELGIPEGRYEIYNQELNARDGRLVFFGNPANPLLDIRAFRETDSGEVGVLLTGNIDSIQGRLYSTPMLPDNEILSLLVTGKSFNNMNAEESDALVGAIASFGLGRGEGLTERVGSTLGLDSFTVGGGSSFDDSALGLGKYLTPDLLMRYKLGLFDRQSVLGIEYTLSDRLKLEVESGISQSVDLNYTIEKD